jgi:hypothetical protein
MEDKETRWGEPDHAEGVKRRPTKTKKTAGPPAGSRIDLLSYSSVLA